MSRHLRPPRLSRARRAMIGLTVAVLATTVSAAIALNRADDGPITPSAQSRLDDRASRGEARVARTPTPTATPSTRATTRSTTAAPRSTTATGRTTPAAARTTPAAASTTATSRTPAVTRSTTAAPKPTSTTTKAATPTPKGCAAYTSYRLTACTLLASFGFATSEMPALDQLWQHESGWNPTAENSSSGAYGIPQALPGSKMATAGSDWATNAATQIRWGLGYIKDRYGSPSAAWAFWQSNGWY